MTGLLNPNSSDFDIFGRGGGCFSYAYLGYGVIVHRV